MPIEFGLSLHQIAILSDLKFCVLFDEKVHIFGYLGLLIFWSHFRMYSFSHKITRMEAILDVIALYIQTLVLPTIELKL